jgi:hypothetical protein
MGSRGRPHRLEPRCAHHAAVCGRALAEGLPLAGLVIVPQRLGTGAAIDDLELLAAAGVKADFQDQVVYLPLGSPRSSV